MPSASGTGASMAGLLEAGSGGASGGWGKAEGWATVRREPQSRQKLAPRGLSMPQCVQLTRPGSPTGVGRSPAPSGASSTFSRCKPPGPLGSLMGVLSGSTEPQSRQYLTWLGLLRPHLPHSTGGGDRGLPSESSPNPMELRGFVRGVGRATRN